MRHKEVKVVGFIISGVIGAVLGIVVGVFGIRFLVVRPLRASMKSLQASEAQIRLEYCSLLSRALGDHDPQITDSLKWFGLANRVKELVAIKEEYDRWITLLDGENIEDLVAKARAFNEIAKLAPWIKAENYSHDHVVKSMQWFRFRSIVLEQIVQLQLQVLVRVSEAIGGMNERRKHWEHLRRILVERVVDTLFTLEFLGLDPQTSQILGLVDPEYFSRIYRQKMSSRKRQSQVALAASELHDQDRPSLQKSAIAWVRQIGELPSFRWIIGDDDTQDGRRLGIRVDVDNLPILKRVCTSKDNIFRVAFLRSPQR